MPLLGRIRQSSSYQVGLLFAALILAGLALTTALLVIAVRGYGSAAAVPPSPTTLLLLGAGLTIVLLLVFTLSYGVSYYVGTRFERAAATTRRIIETGNLRERLPVDSSWDDLSKLAVLLNAMLAELEFRVDGIKAVSDNIAHDLRTPLMRLRTQLETVEDPGKRDELLADLDHILDIFRSLLRISAIEAGKQPLALGPVDAGALLADAAALYEPVAQEQSIRIRVDTPPLAMAADRDLLFQALANLIDNAVKFTPPGGEVVVEGGREGERIRLSVRDSGPGIAAADRERVLTRFQRLDASRAAPGNGLGLPLVLAIARRHGGELRLEDGAGVPPATGLTAALRLPVDAAGARAGAA